MKKKAFTAQKPVVDTSGLIFHLENMGHIIMVVALHLIVLGSVERALHPQSLGGTRHTMLVGPMLRCSSYTRPVSSVPENREE